MSDLVAPTPSDPGAHLGRAGIDSDSPPFFQANHARPQADGLSDLAQSQDYKSRDDTPDKDKDNDADADDIPRSTERPLTHRTRKNSNSDKDGDELLSDIDDEGLDDEQASAGRSNNGEERLAEDEPDGMEDDDSTLPVTIDETVTRTLKASKRRSVNSDASSSGKKPKGGRRVKRGRDDDDDDLGSFDGASGSNNRDPRPRKVRRSTAGAKRKTKNSKEDTNEKEEILTPQEAKARALEKLIDDAIKPTRRRRKKQDDIELDIEFENEIGLLKVRMEQACVADNDAREAGRPAVHKLKMLSEVIALLNRNNVQDILLDPDNNFLQYVKYFLEPLNDGSLPAYSIQRDIFTALTKLPIEKEALLSSGIGKVVLFYTRSKRPEFSIKRMAERLVIEWSRPILKRTDDYKKRRIDTREFDYVAAKRAQREAALVDQYSTPTFNAPDRPRSTALTGAITSRAEYVLEASQPPKLTTHTNNSLLNTLPASYTVAPRSNWDGSTKVDHRPIGAAGDEAFRRMLSNRTKDKASKERHSKR